jgi:hypothetical protein
MCVRTETKVGALSRLSKGDRENDATTVDGDFIKKTRQNKNKKEILTLGARSARVAGHTDTTVQTAIAAVATRATSARLASVTLPPGITLLSLCMACEQRTRQLRRREGISMDEM